MNIDDISLQDLKDEARALDKLKERLEQARTAVDRVEKAAAEAAKSVGDLKQAARLEGT